MPFTAAVGKLCVFSRVSRGTDVVSGVKGEVVVEDGGVVCRLRAGVAGHEDTLESGLHGEAGGHWSDSDFHSGVVGGSGAGAGCSGSTSNSPIGQARKKESQVIS